MARATILIAKSSDGNYYLANFGVKPFRKLQFANGSQDVEALANAMKSGDLNVVCASIVDRKMFANISKDEVNQLCKEFFQDQSEILMLGFEIDDALFDSSKGSLASSFEDLGRFILEVMGVSPLTKEWPRSGLHYDQNPGNWSITVNNNLNVSATGPHPKIAIPFWTVDLSGVETHMNSAPPLPPTAINEDGSLTVSWMSTCTWCTPDAYGYVVFQAPGKAYCAVRIYFTGQFWGMGYVPVYNTWYGPNVPDPALANDDKHYDARWQTPVKDPALSYTFPVEDIGYTVTVTSNTTTTSMSLIIDVADAPASS